MKYTLIKIDGSSTQVEPKLKGGFSLEELQSFVGGYIDIQSLPNGNKIYLNDSGKIDGLMVNEKASEIWRKAYPIEKYPYNNDGIICGDVLYAEREFKKK